MTSKFLSNPGAAMRQMMMLAFLVIAGLLNTVSTASAQTLPAVNSNLTFANQQPLPPLVQNGPQNGPIEFRFTIRNGGSQAGSAEYSTSAGGTGFAAADSSGSFFSRGTINATVDPNCPAGCGAQTGNLFVEDTRTAYGFSSAMHQGAQAGNVYAGSGSAAQSDFTGGIQVIVPVIAVPQVTPATAAITQPLRSDNAVSAGAPSAMSARFVQAANAARR